MTAAQRRTGSAGSFTAAVAEELRAQLARRRVTGNELARRLGVSGQWVSQRTRGVVALSTDDIERIAAALGMTPMDLLGPATGGGTSRPAGDHVIRGNIGARSRGERAVIIPFPQVRDVRPDGRARAGTNGPGSSLVTTRDVAA